MIYLLSLLAVLLIMCVCRFCRFRTDNIDEGAVSEEENIEMDRLSGPTHSSRTVGTETRVEPVTVVEIVDETTRDDDSPL